VSNGGIPYAIMMGVYPIDRNADHPSKAWPACVILNPW